MPVAPSSLAEREHVARVARVTGLLYLAIIGLGLFAEIVVRGGLIERDDPIGTAQAIAADPGLWRLGVVADLLMIVCDVAVAGLVFVVLRPVSGIGAGIGGAFRVLHAAVLGASLLALTVPSILLDGTPATEELGDTSAWVYTAVEVHRYGYLVALVFFAAHLAISGALVVRASYLPSWLGWLLAAAACGYLLDSLTYLLVGGYDGSLSAVTLAPAVVGEVALAAWLVTRGINRDGWDAPIPIERVQELAVDEEDIGYWEDIVDEWSGATRHPSSNRYRR